MSQPEQRPEGMERLRVRRWRFEQFVGLGFTDSASATLAEATVDLSFVRRLIGAGCPPETASLAHRRFEVIHAARPVVSDGARAKPALLMVGVAQSTPYSPRDLRT